MKTASTAIVAQPVAIPGVVGITSPIQLTKWISSTPVTKRLSLSVTGGIEKSTSAAQLFDGHIERLSCSPKSFLRMLKNIGPHDCLSYGVPVNTLATNVLSKRLYKSRGCPPTAMMRTASSMTWPAGPGIIMINYDSMDVALTPDDLLEVFYRLLPALRVSAHIWTASASSCLMHAQTKKELSGINGQRIYMVASDGTDIERAAEVLFRRAWLAGHGAIKISSAGKLLTRTVLDDQVFQSNRIDFCAPAICLLPIVQKKPTPRLYGSAAMALDTRIALPALSALDESKYAEMVDDAKFKRRSEAEEVRAAWKLRRTQELAASGVDPQIAASTITDALEKSVLHSDFLLHTEDGQQVTVAQVLADKDRWHETDFADPLEPDYRGDPRIARAFLKGNGRPTIHSFAHGGQTYVLSPAVRTIRLIAGSRRAYMDEMVVEFLTHNVFYRHADRLVAIANDGSLIEQDDQRISAAMDRTFRFERIKQKNFVAMDGLLADARHLVAAYTIRFPELKAVVTAPTMEPCSGRLIDTIGFDVGSKIFVNISQDFPAVPTNPTPSDVVEALRALYEPIRHFPFLEAADDSVMLAAMLTAVIRPLLPTAPAFAFTAPAQGSGKSLLMRVILAMGGCPLALSSPPDTRSDEELRKRLLASLISGSGAITINNITGEFDSTSMASMITTPTLSDRVLGKTLNATVSTAVLVLLSGNNILFKGELRRRVLPCRIDPQQEDPYLRDFSFDPVELVVRERPKLVVAALTILRASSALEESQRMSIGGSGFAEWDKSVRHSVCWLSQLQSLGTIPSTAGFWRLADPRDAIQTSQAEDPKHAQHRRLIAAWVATTGVGYAQVTVRHLLQFANRRAPGISVDVASPQLAAIPDLLEVLGEIAGDRNTHQINPEKLGRYLGSAAARVVDGHRIMRGGQKQNATEWYVERVEMSGEVGEVVSSTSDNLKKSLTTNKARRRSTSSPSSSTPSASKRPPAQEASPVAS